MLNALRSKGSNVFVWIIIGLLIVGLAGIGISTPSGSGNSAPVASVGDVEVSVDDYVRAMSEQSNMLSARFGRQLNVAELRALGVDRGVLLGLMDQAALENEALQSGISASDDTIRDALLRDPQFQGVDGRFNQQAYEFTLENARYTKAEYDEVLRDAVSRSILQAAVTGGIESPDIAARQIVAFQGERRALEWLRVDETHLTDPLGTADEAALSAVYEADPATYTTPETRQVTVAYVTEGMLINEVAVDDADLLALYDERADEYQSPARRIVDRIVYPSMDAASTALAAFTAGQKSFEDLAAERGLGVDDIDQGEVTEAELNSDAAALVFGANTPGVLGPVETDFGPALFRINAILDAAEMPFEDARPELFEELAYEEASAKIAEVLPEIEVLIAGGAPLEEIAESSVLSLETLTVTRETTDGIAADLAFRDEVFAAGLGEDRDPIDLSDGIAVIRVDEIAEATLQPLSAVRAEVEDAWRREETTRRLTDLAASLAARIDEGEEIGTVASELDVIVVEEAPLGRTDIIEDTPPAFVEEIFDTGLGKSAYTADGATVLLARITEIVPADLMSDENTLAIEAMRGQLNRTITSDALQYFILGLRDNAGVSTDQALLEQILNQLSN